MIPLLADASFWMPEQASNHAAATDRLFYGLLILSTGLFFLVAGVMIAFVWKYRAREGREPEKTPAHSTALELTWTVIPTIVVVAIFYYGFRGYLDMVTSPHNIYEIQVTGYKWGWAFTYPNGYVDENLHVPARRPVRLVLSSQDVIHSVFIPAFRVKKDCVPGRYNKMWFEATREGEYPLYCAEYCGTKHSDMRARVFVEDPSTFRAWLDKAADWVSTMPPVDAGKKLWSARGCSQCHSIDGAPGIGPTFKNLYGKSHPLRDGSTVTVEENYVRQSILEPGSQIVAGFENVMPSYQGRLKDAEVTVIIEFLKSLSDTAPAPIEKLPPAEGAGDGTGDKKEDPR
jgi:cytochrome c oxidase subunit 2